MLYLVLYPGLGNMAGIKGWTQAGQYEEEKAAVEAKAAAWYAPFAAMTVAQLAADPKAMSTARNLFQIELRAVPRLRRRRRQGLPEPHRPELAVGRRCRHGRGDDHRWPHRRRCRPGARSSARTACARSSRTCRPLGGGTSDAALAASGKTLFETNCAACHGVDGKGNPLVGAPNLTDGIWLYGGDATTITETVTNGRNGQMPAFGERLGAQRVQLLAAYATRLAGTGS